jgi:hypothetical protein
VPGSKEGAVSEAASLAPPSPAGNPFVGPRAFEFRDRALFFGRETEIRELRNLAAARRAVLLYAPSGAGKSSLLQAGLLPLLEAEVRGAAVFPVARVSGEVPAGTPAGNAFVWNVLCQITPDDDPAALAPLSLTAGLDRALQALCAQGRPAGPRFLLLDQFEEVFTTRCDGREGRDGGAEAHGFFAQLRTALDAHPAVTLLLALREDYLAPLDAVRAWFPDHLRTRFRLGLLGREAALQAILGPTRQSPVQFTEAAARRLVDNLGPVVDPVQLQVVCLRLWEVGKERGTIDEATLDRVPIGQALGDHYAQEVAAAAGGNPALERRIRDLFDNKLIIDPGVRNQVVRGAETTEEIPTDLLDRLEDAHLLRTEERRGARWYELAHDRLIAVVRDDNRRWRAGRKTPLDHRIELWEQLNEPQSLLLTRFELGDAEERLTAGLEDPSEKKSEFLVRSRRHQEALRRRSKWSAWLLALFITLWLGGLLGLFALARIQFGHLKLEVVLHQDSPDPANRRLAALLAAELSGRAERARPAYDLLQILGAVPPLREPQGILSGLLGEELLLPGEETWTRLPPGAASTVKRPDRGLFARIVGRGLEARITDRGVVEVRAVVERSRSWSVSRSPIAGPLPLPRPDDPPRALAFSPDGKILTAYTLGHRIVRWDVDPKSWREQACRRAGSPLSGTEWREYLKPIPALWNGNDISVCQDILQHEPVAPARETP